MSLKRMYIYLLETFKFPSRLLLSILTAYVIMLNTIDFFDLKGIIITSFTLFCSLLFYRVSDEFKDEETDKKYFPERPFPSGRVKRSDLIFLLYFTILAMLFSNLFALSSFGYCIGLITFCLLMGKWFFLEKYIADNRLMAFLTHSPVSIVMHLYVTAVFCLNNSTPLFTQQNILLILLLSIPGFNWEVFRKTFTEERKGYQTYSSLLGYRNSLALGNLFTFIFLILLFFYNLNTFVFLAMSIISFVYLLFGTYLMITKAQSKLNLQVLSETFNGLIILGLILNGIISQ